MDTLLFKTSYGLYTLSTLLYLGYLFSKKAKLSHAAFWVLILAVSLHAGSMIARTVEARELYLSQAQLLRSQGHSEPAMLAEAAARAYVPWSNWFECFSLFGAVIAIIYLVIAWGSPIPILGTFIMLISWALLTSALLHPEQIQPLAPGLQSYWFAIHVPLVFTAYSLLTIAGAVALAYLIEERQMKRKQLTFISFHLPSLDQLDVMMFRLIAIGVPLLVLGILVGGIWAYSAWGRFWGWDPKETAALVTLCVYLFYLQRRFFAGWRGRKAAYMTIAGFASMYLTFIGINYLSPLHGFLTHTP